MSTTTLTPTGTATQGPPRRSLVRDTTIVLARELRPTLHDPFSVVFSLVQPIFFLALFGPLLAGNLGGGLPGGDVWQWFVPAILVMISLFGSSTVGANLLYEMQTGAHERMLVTPLARSSLLVGRALKEIVTLVAQAAVIVLVMLPFGFRLHPLGALTGLVLLAVLGVGISSFSYALALAVRKQDWMFWVVQQTVLFPVMILSGMLLPLEGGPGWMRALARLNPLTYVVDAERALFAGDLLAAPVLWGFGAAGVTAALGLALGIRSMRRSD
ncbi:ABC transporter permease [Ornithinimicrobium cerasi]|uniref:ABC transporter permease n=1 Tax=Ornithinimicrobium cerasi TaxID=2248773 RepID=UPI000F0015E6|nr:ABC transporter permease [Ornithinimicrobium cerasi]